MMNTSSIRKKFFLLPIVIFVHLGVMSLMCQQELDLHELSTASSGQELLDTKAKIIYMNYVDEDLVFIVNSLAELKGVNVIFPQGAEAIKSKVNLKIPNPMVIDEAWNYLYTILDVAGFMLAAQSDGSYMIVKRDKSSITPTTLYIGVSPLDLPRTDECIRYLYYFSNIKVASPNSDPKNEVNAILQSVLGSSTASSFGITSTAPSSTMYKVDPVSNSILIIAKSSQIREVMGIILELDNAEFQEKMEFLELQFADARTVADLFSADILGGAKESRYNLDTRRIPENAYFSPNARLIPIAYRNAVIILGRTQAVDRIREFIINNIDQEPKTGKSVLHVYQLQYLDAEPFVEILTKAVTKTVSAANDRIQSSSEQGESTQREFDQVLIRCDKPLEGSASQRLNRFSAGRDVKSGELGQESRDEQVYYGGNKLIIACRNDDWEEIKRLIEVLDTPQPQVLLEVLIADLTIDDSRQLGSLTRNPLKIPILNTMQFQSGQLPLNAVNGIIPNSWDTPTTIASDLLRKGFDADGKPSDAGPNSATVFAPAGSGMISLNDNDGETWSIIQFLKSFSNAKILSHPHVVAVNNRTAVVSVGEERRLFDEASGALGGTTSVELKKINALLRVEVTPLITSPDTVNLQIDIKVEDFIGPNNNKTIRSIKTNATVRNNAVWALGGLVRTSNVEAVNDTPILSKIPIIGKFFSRESEDATKNNLTVLISPTIIEPRLRQGMGVYTHDYIEMAKTYAREGSIFDQTNEPISRWFFQAGADIPGTFDAFAQQKPLPSAMYRPRVPNRKQKKSAPLSSDLEPEAAVSQIQSEPQDEVSYDAAVDKNSLAPDPVDAYSTKTNLDDEEESIVVVKNDEGKQAPLAQKKNISLLQDVLRDEINPFLVAVQKKQ